jgi:hypothetical protein
LQGQAAGNRNQSWFSLRDSRVGELSCEVPIQAGTLRQIAWATRIEPIPVDDPGFWQGTTGFRWISEAEAHAADRGKTFVRSPGYGMIEL